MRGPVLDPASAMLPAVAPAQVSRSLDRCEHLYRFGGYPPLDWLATQLEAQLGDSVEAAFY